MVPAASPRKLAGRSWLTVLVMRGVLLPLVRLEAQPVRLAPPGNAVAKPLPSLDEGAANIERQDRLRGRAVLPGMRGREGSLQQAPDAVKLGVIEPPKEMRPR